MVSFFICFIFVPDGSLFVFGSYEILVLPLYRVPINSAYRFFFGFVYNAVFFFFLVLLLTGVRERAARVCGGGYRRHRFRRGVHELLSQDAHGKARRRLACVSFLLPAGP